MVAVSIPATLFGLNIGMAPGASAQGVVIPVMSKGAAAYIAQNHMRHAEIAIAGLKLSVLLRMDDGSILKPVAQNGAARE